jgi:hypothetical protein
VAPWFQGTPPLWLTQVWPQVANAYAIRDFVINDQPLSHTLLPFGANYAVVTNQQRLHLYDPTLGRNKDGLLGGEEVTVMHQMLDKGLTGRWVPGARVRHYIPRDRQTIGYLRKYYLAQGLYQAGAFHAGKCLRFLGKPRWLWRMALQAEMSYRWQRLVGTPQTWIGRLITASTLWGQLWGHNGKRCDR